MQTHLKERLTGAALLVLIVVLLVPEMFRGHPAPTPRAASSALDGPPVRSYTIDLRDNAAAQPLPGGAPLSASPTQNASAAAATEAPAVAAPAELKPSAPPITAPPAATPAHLAAPPHGAAPAGWTVQVGSFARRDFAERMVRQMKARGFAVQVAGPDDKGLYRVRSAALADRARALALRQQMLQKGLKPIVNTLP